MQTEVLVEKTVRLQACLIIDRICVEIPENSFSRISFQVTYAIKPYISYPSYTVAAIS